MTYESITFNYLFSVISSEDFFHVLQASHFSLPVLLKP